MDPLRQQTQAGSPFPSPRSLRPGLPGARCPSGPGGDGSPSRTWGPGPRSLRIRVGGSRVCARWDSPGPPHLSGLPKAGGGCRAQAACPRRVHSAARLRPAGRAAGSRCPELGGGRPCPRARHGSAPSSSPGGARPGRPQPSEGPWCQLALQHGGRARPQGGAPDAPLPGPHVPQSLLAPCAS